ncbi:MAG: hypothetical protein NZ853_06130 [Leptospiraceae bacterium]|nr:hypothetical protein [Leptospiraceae bacterium]MDW7976471.1 hypothetical protein [Leptospiraceae bacterium]
MIEVKSSFSDNKKEALEQIKKYLTSDEYENASFGTITYGLQLETNTKMT